MSTEPSAPKSDMPKLDFKLMKSIIALLPDEKERALRILDAARRMVERFKR
jgi:hypothetical protein